MPQHSRRPRWILTFMLTTIILALGMMGCKETEPPPEPVTITFGHPDYQTAYFEIQVEAFQEIHPEITVELQPIFGNNFSGSIDIDAFSLDLFSYIQNQIQGAFLDLSPHVELDKSFDASDFYQGTFDLFSSQGKLWAIPAGINAYVMYYNQDLFDQNGLAYPTNGWTWDDMLTVAMVISDEDSDTYGYGVTENYLDINAMILIHQHGGSLFNDLDSPTEMIYNSPLNIEAMQWYGDLYQRHKVAPTPGKAGTAYGYGDQALMRGILMSKIAMWPGYFLERGGFSWPVTWDKLNWGMVALPGDANTATSGFGDGYAIASTSENHEAAWEWIVYLSEQIPMSLIPARKSLAESDEFKSLVGTDAAAAALSSLENITLINPSLIQFAGAIQAFNPAVLDIIEGNTTAQEALDRAQDQIQGP